MPNLVFNLCAMQTETIFIHPDQRHAVTLNNRGSSGLQMQVTADHADVVRITRRHTAPLEGMMPGDPLQVTFDIEGLQPGTTEVTFFETRPWDKSFAPIIAKKLIVKVM